jgi:hypothetical protein
MSEKDAESLVQNSMFKQSNGGNKIINSNIEILNRPNGAVYKG